MAVARHVPNAVADALEQLPHRLFVKGLLLQVGRRDPAACNAGLLQGGRALVNHAVARTGVAVTGCTIDPEALSASFDGLRRWGDLAREGTRKNAVDHALVHVLVGLELSHGDGTVRRQAHRPVILEEWIF